MVWVATVCAYEAQKQGGTDWCRKVGLGGYVAGCGRAGSSLKLASLSGVGTPLLK
jgi:hypothetical protein